MWGLARKSGFRFGLVGVGVRWDYVPRILQPTGFSPPNTRVFLHDCDLPNDEPVFTRVILLGRSWAALHIACLQSFSPLPADSPIGLVAPLERHFLGLGYWRSCNVRHDFGPTSSSCFRRAFQRVAVRATALPKRALKVAPATKTGLATRGWRA